MFLPRAKEHRSLRKTEGWDSGTTAQSAEASEKQIPHRLKPRRNDNNLRALLARVNSCPSQINSIQNPTSCHSPPFRNRREKAGDPIAHVAGKIGTPGENALMRRCCSRRSRGPSTRSCPRKRRHSLAQDDIGVGWFAAWPKPCPDTNRGYCPKIRTLPNRVPCCSLSLIYAILCMDRARSTI